MRASLVVRHPLLGGALDSRQPLFPVFRRRDDTPCKANIELGVHTASQRAVEWDWVGLQTKKVYIWDFKNTLALLSWALLPKPACSKWLANTKQGDAFGPKERDLLAIKVVHKKHVISRPNLLWHDMKISDCEQLLLHTVLAISGTLLDSCIASKAGDRSFRLRESEGLRKWFHWQCAQPIG